MAAASATLARPPPTAPTRWSPGWRATWGPRIAKVRPWQLATILARGLGFRHEVRDIGPFQVLVDEASVFGATLLAQNDLSPDLSAALAERLPPGGTFVDLGANEGWFSLVAAHAVGPSGRVLAIEPQARLWPILLANFSLNGILNVRLAPVAVGDVDGTATLRLSPGVNTGASTLVAGPRDRLKRGVPTLVRRLDALLDAQGLDRVDVIKIDIEGYELKALEGAVESLKARRIRDVIVEIHERELAALGSSGRDVEALLASHGFRAATTTSGFPFHTLDA